MKNKKEPVSLVKIEEQGVADVLRTNYMPYAMSVIISRAIPEIDGFKPSHRKLLYMMYTMGLLSSKATKCANIVGQTMKLNPHGDSSIYDTMVRMTDSNESLLFPYVQGKGSFGKHFSRDMTPASYRYTEAKLHKNSNLIFGDIDKNCVDFIDNYDGTMKEPVLLPVQFPTILVNSNQGIAVGMASNICSFNLSELCYTTIALMKSPKAILEKTLIAPDFSTGGELILDRSNLSSVYETGKGSVVVKSVYSYDKKSNTIEVSEIPYSTTIEAIMDKIIELVKTNKVTEVQNIRDETDLKGFKLAIELKKDVNPDKLMNKLFSLTPLIDSFSCNFNILIQGYPKVVGVREILLNWIDFRIDCLRKSLSYDLSKKEKRLHLLEGVTKVSLNIDAAIKLIRGTQNDADVVPALMKKFKIDEIQAEYIADIKLRNLNKNYLLNMIKNMDDLKAEIDNLKLVIGDDKKIKEIITKQLKEIAKVSGEPRRTKILETFNSDFVPNSIDDTAATSVIITKEHYIKRLPIVKVPQEQKIKDGDEILFSGEVPLNTEVLLFVETGDVYKTRVSELPEGKAANLGDYLPSINNISVKENPVYSCFLDEKKFLLFCFENGKIAKVPMSSYLTLTNRKKLSNAFYTKSKLIQICECSKDDMLIIRGVNDKQFMINESKISEKTTRSSMGISVFKGCIKDISVNNSVKIFSPKTLPSAGK